jgi:hypothetical protein
LKKDVDITGDSVYTGIINKLDHKVIYATIAPTILCFWARQSPLRVLFFVSLPIRKEKCSMDYGLIGKIEKAKRYADERDRIEFKQFTVKFEGENNDHTVSYQDGDWHCDCDFFQTRGRCSHTMALEIILEDMVALAQVD